MLTEEQKLELNLHGYSVQLGYHDVQSQNKWKRAVWWQAYLHNNVLHNATTEKQAWSFARRHFLRRRLGLGYPMPI